MPNDMPPPQAVDYSGRPLTEGDTVAFITTDPVGLCEGRIRIIGPNDLCIDTGRHLVTFRAARQFIGVPPIRPLDGTVKPRPIPDGAQQYPQVALQSTEGRYQVKDVRLCLGPDEIGAEVGGMLRKARRQAPGGDA